MLNLFTATLFILLPFQTQWILRAGVLRTEAWQYGTIGVYGTDLLIVLCAFLLFKKNKYRLHAAVLPSLVWVFFSIFWSSDRSVAFMHALWLTEAMMVAWIVARSRAEQVAVPFIVGSVFQAFVGLWQFFTQSTISSSIMGWAVHPAVTGGTSVIETVDGRWLRAYAGFPHPNMFGGWMAVAMIILTVQYSLSLSKGRWVRLLVCISLIILTGGLIVSFSRSAWLATMVGILILSFLRRRESRIVLIKIMIVIGLTAVSVLLPYRSLLTTRFTPTARLEQKSIDERETGYRDALKLIRAHPIIGVGIGNYTNALAPREPTRPIWAVQPVHNVFVLIFGELGLIGLVLAMVTLYRLVRSRVSPMNYPLLAIGLTLALSDHYLWSLHGGLLLFGVYMGTVMSIDPAEGHNERCGVDETPVSS